MKSIFSRKKKAPKIDSPPSHQIEALDIPHGPAQHVISAPGHTASGLFSSHCITN